MKINLYNMLKTLHFTMQNGKNLSSAMVLLANASKTKKERQTFESIHKDLKEGVYFSDSLRKHQLGSLDVIEFIAMAEKGIDFQKALEKVIHYLDVKEGFERDSSDKISLPIIYFMIATLIVIGVKFFAVPYQIEKSMQQSKEILELIVAHLTMAQFMSDMLFIALIVVALYFATLLLAIFSQSHTIQAMAKEASLLFPISKRIILKFEKFLLFSMMGEMLESGIGLKKVMLSAMQTTTVERYKKALEETLYSIKHEGKLLLHSTLYDEIEKGLLTGVGSSRQIGAVMLEVSIKAKSEALVLSSKFFRMITFISILLMAFAVFIEFYTVVLTQILIQKGLIDASRSLSF